MSYFITKYLLVGSSNALQCHTCKSYKYSCISELKTCRSEEKYCLVENLNIFIKSFIFQILIFFMWFKKAVGSDDAIEKKCAASCPASANFQAIPELNRTEIRYNNYCCRTTGCNASPYMLPNKSLCVAMMIALIFSIFF